MTDLALPNELPAGASPFAACAACSARTSESVSPKNDSPPAWMRSRRETPPQTFLLFPRIVSISLRSYCVLRKGLGPNQPLAGQAVVCADRLRSTHYAVR